MVLHFFSNRVTFPPVSPNSDSEHVYAHLHFDDGHVLGDRALLTLPGAQFAD